MVAKNTDHSNGRLSRDDWLRAALETMRTVGVSGVKVAPLAARMGVTTGSFYWHFKNRRELLDLLLGYWEREMTDAAMEAVTRFEGPPEDRILFLMQRVMEGDLAGYDLPIWQWAQSDSGARTVFNRALKKRIEFTTALFRKAGFSPSDAKNRAHLMVVYMMGESTLVRQANSASKRAIRGKYSVLISRSEGEDPD